MDNYYAISVDKQLEAGALNEGLYVFIIHATRIPPHLGLIYNGKVYDINVRGKKMGIDVEGFIEFLNQKGIPALFFKISEEDKTDLESKIKYQISSFDQVKDNATCLAPVKGFFNDYYISGADQAKFIFELLPILYSSKLMVSVTYLGLEDHIENGVFHLKKYTMKDIEARVNELNQPPIAEQ